MNNRRRGEQIPIGWMITSVSRGVCLSRIMLLAAALLVGSNAALAAPPSAGSRVTAIVDHDRTRDFPDTAASAMALSIPLPEGQLDLTLIPTDVFTEDVIIREIGEVTITRPRPAPKYYIGHGGSDVKAYMALTEGSVMGIVVRDKETFYVEPYRRYDRKAGPRDLHVVRKSSLPPRKQGSPEKDCRQEEEEEEEAAGTGALGDLLAALSELRPELGVTEAFALPVPSGTLRLAKLAFVVDYQYLQLANGDTSKVTDFLGTIILLADASYLRDLGLTLRIASLEIFTTAAASDAVFHGPTKIYDCRDHRVAQAHAASGYAVTQCITGNSNYPGGGEALGSAGYCGYYGVSLVKAASPLTTYPPQLEAATVLPAHELGHNFGASHLDSSSCGSLALPLKRCTGVDAGCNVNADCSTTACPSSHRCPITNAYCATASSCAPVCGPNLKDEGYIMWWQANWPNAGLPLGQCALNQIKGKLTNGNGEAACLVNVKCGDVNRNGTVTASDALAALQLANCFTCSYDGLADVFPKGSPSGTITQEDSNLILNVAVGAETLTNCGNYPAPYTP